jgi:methylmalonyl-CoA carboxyltransferase large subunit
MSMADKIAELVKKREELKLGGGKARIEKQHESGKLSARERIDLLVDSETFQETGLFAQHRATFFGMAGKELPADGVVTGAANVDGRLIHLASQDFTVGGGAAGEVHSDKIVEMMEASINTGTPFVFINDSGGARIQEGIDSLAGYGRVFYNNVKLSGVVPKYANMFITGPSVVKQVTGEVVTADQLGGPGAQMSQSGVVHFVAEDDEHATQICRKLLSYLPSNNMEDPPRMEHSGQVERDDSLNTVIPEEAKKAYDMREIILRVVDDGDFLEVQSEYAKWALRGFLAAPSASSAISPPCSPVRSISMRRISPRASSASATPSTSRW